MARQVLENGVVLPAEYSDDWYDDMTSNLTKLDDVIGSDSEKLSSADVGAAALSNNYNDLDNLPTIPTVNDAALTIQKNGVDVQTFTANASSNVTCNITVPTKTSDLTNDSNFVDTSNSAVSSGITSAKVNDYDTHIADTDIHVTTADKNRWNNNTYVFRYSSTALTASSTNSNTLLDNTDNLKVGDKVIDSSGVLFSITAIDTQNSTFTIGTALVDLAQDSDVVHKSGDETIGGSKTFSDTIVLQGTTTPTVKTISNIIQDSTSGNETISRIVRDKTDTHDVFSESVNKFSARSVDYRLNITAINNDTEYTAGVRLIADPSNNAKNFISSGNNTITLGNSGNRWRSVYSYEYYYGTNNTPFTDKFVTTDTNQTISGAKTFTDNMQLKSNVAEYGVTGGNIQFYLMDKNNVGLSKINQGVFNSGVSYIALQLYSRDSNNQTISNSITYQYSNNFSNTYLLPNDNSVWLGSNGQRWGKIFGIQYYYGSNNVEFSTKFVTTDTNQTISGNKTFSSNVNVYNSDNTASTPNFTLRSSKSAIGTSDTDVQTIFFSDKNGASLASVKAQNFTSNGATYLLNSVNTKDTNDQIIEASTSLYILNNGRKVFRPNADNDIFLGYSLQKWKDCQTYLINGVEPSSLSLPSDRSARIDISSYITNLGNGDNNQYTVPANGYIWLRFTSINSALCYSQTSGGLTNYAQTFVRYQGDGQLYAFFPVRKSDTFIVQIYTSSTAVVESAYFIPCQGNV